MNNPQFPSWEPTDLGRRYGPEAVLGFIPLMLSSADNRPASAQFNDNYVHGGGWRPFHGFTPSEGGISLAYAGDPPTRALAFTYLREEKIVVYEHAWVGIFQPDGKFEISRMD